MTRKLDTSTLGAIRVRPPSPPLQREARRRLANALRGMGSGYANTADSIEAGTYGNMWTIAALAAIEGALREGPDEE